MPLSCATSFTNRRKITCSDNTGPSSCIHLCPGWMVIVSRTGSILSLLLTATVWVSCGGAGASAGPGPQATSGVEILYVIQGSSIATYRIDGVTAALTPAGLPVATDGPDFSALVPSPDGHFVYQDWGDAAGGHVRAYRTDVSGVPQLPLVQSLELPVAGTLMMHPSGRLAYYMHEGVVGDSETGTMVADIWAFQVDAKTGQLTQSAGPVASSSGPAMFWSDSLYGFSSDGTQLYEYSGASFDGESKYGFHPACDRSANWGARHCSSILHRQQHVG